MKRRRPGSLVTVQEHTEQACKDMTTQVLSLAQRFEEQIGKGAGSQLVATFLKTFVGASAFTVLMNEAEKGDRGEADAARCIQSFSSFKTELQDAVANGFGDAMFQFSGRNMDFYCTISPVPEPINEQPC